MLSRQRISIITLLALSFAILLTVQSVRAVSPPAQGCTTDANTGITTCAFYVMANEDDAGTRPECDYLVYSTDIYFGQCNGSGISIVNGFIFRNVSLPIPAGQSILSSYAEFTVDGPYGPNTITANIYGQASTSPNSFSGSSATDITNRPTVSPTAQWIIPSTNTTHNMGDPWNLGDIRRTPDVTSILTAIVGSGWQNNNSIALLFKNMTANPLSSRRVTAKDRAGELPARLVFRVGEIPKPSVSYYWQSTTTSNNTTIIDPVILEKKAKTEAQRNQSVLVILDFGSTVYNGTNIGSKLVSTTTYVSTSALLNGAKTYIQKFIQYSSPNSYLWLGVGTNNTGDMMCTITTASNHGQAWALMMNDLQTWVVQQGYDSIVKVSGANDFESWAGKKLKCGNQLRDPSPPQNALAWAQSYSTNTDVILINYGAVDSTAIGLGDSQWGGETYWQLAWGIPEAYPLPEIYSPAGGNATNWQNLARMSAICTGCLPEQWATNPNWTKGRNMQFLGMLTNYGEQRCSSQANPPKQGWLQLYRKLTVDVITDGVFPKYSSDITFEDQDAHGGNPHPTADTCPPVP